MPEVTLGIDIGTTSVKGLAVAGDGRVIARSRRRHDVGSPKPGQLQHDVDVAWRDNVRRVYSEIAGGQAILGVQVSAMIPSLAAVDERGRALTPGLLYGDERGEAELGRSPADSGEFLGFARWLANEAPEAAGYWPAQAVANHALAGIGAIDSTTAMAAVPLFDYVGWDAEVAAEIGADPAKFPQVSSGTDAIGEVSGAPIGGGTIDALGEQWVAGANETGDVLVICGASLITWAVVDDWLEVPGLWTVPHTAPGKILIGGPSNAGGLFVDWANRMLPDDLPDVIDPANVPVWAPYPGGERTPLHDPHRSAQLQDLTLTHGPAEVRRATYEAAGFVVRHHLDLADAATDRIVATGGGAKSATWMQALADCTGLPVDVVAVPEGAAYGAAFLARVTAGIEEKAEDAVRWARTDRRVEPRSHWAAAVAGRYERFRELTGPPGPADSSGS